MEADRQRSLDAGCNDCVSKLIDKADLLRKISAWLAQS